MITASLYIKLPTHRIKQRTEVSRPALTFEYESHESRRGRTSLNLNPSKLFKRIYWAETLINGIYHFEVDYLIDYIWLYRFGLSLQQLKALALMWNINPELSNICQARQLYHTRLLNPNPRLYNDETWRCSLPEC